MRRSAGAEHALRPSFEARLMQLGAMEIVIDRSGGLYLPSERTLVVADLHLEKGSSFASRGTLLPPYDTRETLDRLEAVVGRYRPSRVIALGDSLHDGHAEHRLGPAERHRIARLQSGRDWLWITGNHDPEISASIGGEALDVIVLAGTVLRHAPEPGHATAEIAGHLHPAARVLLGGVGMRRPCFIGDARRMVLPAFGAFAGGLNVLDEAFAPLFPGSAFAVHVLGRDGVYPVACGALGPD